MGVDISRPTEVSVSLCDASLPRPRQYLDSGKKLPQIRFPPERDLRERHKYKKYTTGISRGRAGQETGGEASTEYTGETTMDR